MFLFLFAVLLAVFGVAAVAAALVTGTAFDLGVHVASQDMAMFRDRWQIFPGGQLVVVATLVSLLLPPAWFGWRLLAGRPGWGNRPGWTLFALSGAFLLPLRLIFPATDLSLGHVLMSRESYALPFFALWWTHGGINALRARRLAAR